jgi:hypothetical protein
MPFFFISKKDACTKKPCNEQKGLKEGRICFKGNK